ncbi:MAG: hypothetical protein KDC80_23980 [Saprospiraceae bacterium]|nr:hypothetical protein [Saprospiraceae bacterium]
MADQIEKIDQNRSKNNGFHFKARGCEQDIGINLSFTPLDDLTLTG